MRKRRRKWILRITMRRWESASCYPVKFCANSKRSFIQVTHKWTFFIYFAFIQATESLLTSCFLRPTSERRWCWILSQKQEFRFKWKVVYSEKIIRLSFAVSCYILGDADTDLQTICIKNHQIRCGVETHARVSACYHVSATDPDRNIPSLKAWLRICKRFTSTCYYLSAFHSMLKDAASCNATVASIVTKFSFCFCLLWSITAKFNSVDGSVFVSHTSAY